MRALPFVVLSLFLLGSLGLTPALADSFDQNVTPDAIFGTGNANGSWTVDRASGIELGLRAKLRYNASGLPENTFNSNGDGTYSFAAGVAPTQSSPVGVWSFEWSINTDYASSTGINLDDLTYVLAIDSNPGAGTTFTGADPINVAYADHSIGTNATGNGGGTEAAFLDTAGYAALIANNNVAQNSWQANWFIGSFDPTVDGVYDFTLSAYSRTTSQLIVDVGMQVIVGSGAPVPEPGTMALLAIGLIGVGLVRRRRRVITR